MGTGQVIPDVSFDSADFAEAEATAQEVRQRAEEMGKKVNQAVAYVDRAKTATREALEEEPLKTKLPLAVSFLEECNSPEEKPAIRRKAWTALVEYELTREAETQQEVLGIFDSLANRKLLIFDPTGKAILRVYDRHYEIPDLGFKDNEIEAIVMLVKELLGRTEEKIAKDMRARGNLSWRDVRGKKKGLWCANAPDAIELINKAPVRQRRTLVFCYADGQTIFPRSGNTNLRIAPVRINDARGKREVGIRIDSLVPERDKPIFSEYVPDKEQVKRLYFVWMILRRAVLAELKEEEMAPIRQSFSERTTIEAARFLLEGVAGHALVSYRGTWEETDSDGNITNLIPHMFLLVERKETEDGKKVGITAVPAHLEQFFRNCRGEYAESGERFAGVAYPLRAVLQACNRQAYEDAKNESKVA